MAVLLEKWRIDSLMRKVALAVVWINRLQDNGL
jgi:hypothetical protein